ncbi:MULTISPECIES: 2Fe-2S iron-sulfur cluster-binding protein [unclassified Shewanella]|uniref:2Fe-2S iron-sulfur cluster-binding protein n=1 Tax=unclassified Shewanella TaxID=196818 RepID=UPI000C84ADC8
MMSDISLTINGKLVGPIDVGTDVMMIEFLHEYLNMTGTKFGCGEGICHACVVIVDNDDGSSSTVRTCISGAHAFNNFKIRTIEGHAKTNNMGEIIQLSPVQESFIKHFAFQCGWCTSGFTNETTLLIEKLQKAPINKADVEAVILESLGEHVCRCTGYVKYYQAVKELILTTEGLTT